MLVLCSVPLYYEIKLVGLLWLMTPQTKGAQLLYETVINPFLTQHAAKFDPVFATTKLVSGFILTSFHVCMLLYVAYQLLLQYCDRGLACFCAVACRRLTMPKWTSWYNWPRCMALKSLEELSVRYSLRIS